MRDKHRDKTACGPVEASPEKAAGEGCKDENRVARWKMDRCVEKCCEGKSGPGAPFLSEAPLHKASPKHFLPEPDGEKEQKAHEGRGEPSEVRINSSDVPCTVRKKSRKKPAYQQEKLVPHVENGIKQGSEENSNENILHGELSARKERSSERKSDGRENRSAQGEQDPEIEGSVDEHDDPERKSQHNAGPQPFL